MMRIIIIIIIIIIMIIMIMCGLFVSLTASVHLFYFFMDRLASSSLM